MPEETDVEPRSPAEGAGEELFAMPLLPSRKACRVSDKSAARVTGPTLESNEFRRVPEREFGLELPHKPALEHGRELLLAGEARLWNRAPQPLQSIVTSVLLPSRCSLESSKPTLASVLRPPVALPVRP